MKISKIDLNFRQNIIKNINNKKDSGLLSNSFKFTKESSNAIKANVLSNISFTSSSLDKITEEKVEEKRVKLYKKALEIWNEKAKVYYDALQHLDAVEMLKRDMLKDYHTIPGAEIEKGIQDGEIVDAGFSVYDRLEKNKIYSVELDKGKWKTITTYNIFGNKEKIIELDIQTGNIVSILTTNDQDVPVKYTYKKDANGKIVPKEYIENKQMKHNCKIRTNKYIEFYNEKSFLYRVNMLEKPGYFRVFSVEKEFEFTDLSCFTYTKNYEINPFKHLEKSDDKIKIKDYKITDWSEGFIKAKGKRIQKPSIVLEDGKIVKRCTIQTNE